MRVSLTELPEMNPLNGADFTGECDWELVGGLVGVVDDCENMLLRKTVEMHSTCIRVVHTCTCT